MFSTTFVAIASLSALVQAYTPPKGDPTWGPLRTPDLSSQVVRGEKFKITWDPETRSTNGVTVSLVLCKGPGSNCQLQPSAIAEKLPAGQKSFDWYVPCDLAPGTASSPTGYGMAVIVDQTGEYQYSTQFSIQEGSSCSVDPTNPSSSSTISTFDTVPLPTETQSISTSPPRSPSPVVVTGDASSTTSTRPSTTTMTTTRTTSPVAASNTASTTSSTTNAAVAKATNAAGAMVAVGLALLAM